MMEINWREDYKGEFICPHCNQLGMKYYQKTIIKDSVHYILLICPQCNKSSLNTHVININPISDPVNEGLIWYTNHKIKGFVCPDCNSENIYFHEINKSMNKIRFRCRTCQKTYFAYSSLRLNNITSKSCKSLTIVPMQFDDDKWDLRAINPNYDERDHGYLFINFEEIKISWFKIIVKKYIEFQCKKEKAFRTINKYLVVFRSFSIYLSKLKIKISKFSQINRSLILDYLSKEKIVDRKLLGTLRNFFKTGTIKGWFNIDQDIIRDEDYPKTRKSNPDPLSDTVREQIEKNLYKLPKPIARMWLICFFAAMRPSELALLKKDCLLQEGHNWSLVWYRKKTNDYHQVPITRIIAKVVQEQLDYINNLWGEEWEFLFCHYHGLSDVNLTQPKLEPVKKVISAVESPLKVVVKCLIKAEDIRNENGKLARFTEKILRSTRLTELFEQGHDLAVIKAWAGHKDLETTGTYYTEVSCDLIEKETAHIQKALVNTDGKPLNYESMPKYFWENPNAYKLELAATHINTPIYGYCVLPLDQQCDKFRACFDDCPCFHAAPEKLSVYIENRNELRKKQAWALENGHDVLMEQYGRQADNLDEIINEIMDSLEEKEE